MARTSPHSSDALPAPVAPAIRTCVPWSLTSQGSPSSRLPTGSALRSGLAGIGRAGTRTARASRRMNSSTTAPDRADRTRHSIAPNPCARLSACSAKSAGDWPETSRTMHPVGIPGSGDLAQHGQQGPALIPGSHPGDRHHRGPPAPVAPGPPLAPGRAADPPGERARPEPPPGGQHDDDGQDQGHEGDPAELDPDHRGQRPGRWRPADAGRSAGRSSPAAGRT